MSPNTLQSLLRYALSYTVGAGLRFPALVESGLTRTALQLVFSLLAPHYDRYGTSLGLLGNPHWEVVADILGDDPHDILDLSTGTGDCAFQLAALFPNARVTGVDISGPMLDAARHKATEAGVEQRVTFVNGDAAMLPFADASFDLVVVQNGPIFVEEMVRVCRVGKTIAAGWALANYGIVAQAARRRFEIGGVSGIHTRPAGLGMVISGVVP